jgi:SAM-dependent methyltransferase
VPLHRVDGSLIVRCEECQLVRQASRPTAPGALYRSSYYATENPKGGYANYFLDADINRRTFQRRLQAIEIRLGRRGRILDVGCALGDFLAEARARGWNTEGVEVSAYAAARARDIGLCVHVGSLEELALEAASFDVVTLYDTIEHLPDPLATLQEVNRLLVPGGLLHVVTPNVGGIQSRLLGRRWYHYKPGEHLFYFEPKTLQSVLRRAGLSWECAYRSGSYVTVTYMLNRLRYYAPRLFAALEWTGRQLQLGPFAFYAYVGEMEAWARRAA